MTPQRTYQTDICLELIKKNHGAPLTTWNVAALSNGRLSYEQAKQALHKLKRRSIVSHNATLDYWSLKG